MSINDSREEIIKKRGYRNDICGDQHSLYISSYKETVKYLAQRIVKDGKSVTELCCGIGISLIELAKVFDKVVGVDFDKKILLDCRQNLVDSGLSDKIDLILGDVKDKKLLSNINSDIVIYDIPYWETKKLSDRNKLDRNPNLEEIISNIQNLITRNIVIFTPPNFSENEIKKFGDYEYQKVYVNDRHDRNYIYLGNLVKTIGINKIEFVC